MTKELLCLPRESILCQLKSQEMPSKGQPLRPRGPVNLNNCITVKRHKNKHIPAILPQEYHLFREPPASMANIQDVPLLIIFDHLPLHDLLGPVKLVCTRWNILLPSACARRRSLTLLVGSRDWYRSIKSTTPELDELVNEDGYRAAGWWSNSLFPKVNCHTLDARRVNYLIRLFPSIVNLAVAISDTDLFTISHIVSFLNYWRPSIITLKLMSSTLNSTGGSLYFDQGTDQLGPLVDSINCLPILRHLSLDCFHNLFGSRNESLLLKVIRQLETFSFFSKDPIDRVLKQIVDYGTPNKALRAIALKTPFDMAEKKGIEVAFKLEDHLGSLFTLIQVKTRSASDDLQRLASKFPKLASLSLSMFVMLIYLRC